MNLMAKQSFIQKNCIWVQKQVQKDLKFWNSLKINKNPSYFTFQAYGNNIQMKITDIFIIKLHKNSLVLVSNYVNDCCLKTITNL